MKSLFAYLMLQLLHQTAPAVGESTSGVLFDLTSQEVIQIVDTHNYLRSTVDPSALNMQPLVRWGEALCQSVRDVDNFSEVY